MTKPGPKPGLTCSPRTHWLAKALIDIMRDRAITSVEISKRAGFGAATIYQWASGKNTNPTIRNLEALANELGYRIVLQKEKT